MDLKGGSKNHRAGSELQRTAERTHFNPAAAKLATSERSSFPNLPRSTSGRQDLELEPILRGSVGKLLCSAGPRSPHVASHGREGEKDERERHRSVRPGTLSQTLRHPRHASRPSPRTALSERECQLPRLHHELRPFPAANLGHLRADF